MNDRKAVEVRLWDKVVGYVALSQSGVPQFSYDDDFKSESLEISPLEISTKTTIVFNQSSNANTFAGLPGVIADCLPDRFGMRVIRDFYKNKYKLEEHEINVIKKILYISNRAIGALEFYPSISDQDDKPEEQFLEIQRLRDEAKKTLEGKADLVTAKIMRVGGSAGGAQAKALIDYNPTTEQMKNGFVEATPGFIPSIIKFDGVRDGDEEGCYGRLEYTYYELARKCGIEVPKTYLLEEETRAHFIVERFDRNEKKEKNFHYASLCGLLTKDYMQKHSCSYEEYFQLTLYLTENASQVVSAFKRAVFNIIFRNQDDHTKIFGFLMNKKGGWKLAPAFDLNYVFDGGNTKTHQMKLNGKDENFEYSDFLTSGTEVGIKKSQIKKILNDTLYIANEFKALAFKNGLEEDFVNGVYGRFRLDIDVS